ncbi:MULTISPECIES: hypothetical protein [Pseudomonas fluorescens group]|uniref:Uncharacterized protein n=1 Tax=Pseudomonas azotoformans TaxID=47878 RepID=A0A4Q0HXL1_PSEAZ|nr:MULTISPECIES: hypothetical protein [Pseudomonas fluorescens group]RXE52669.1 hypothetical protein B4O85_15080 [Pseudomonas azotoformans]
MTKLSSTKKEKQEKEEAQLFDLALPLLKKIYKEFIIDEAQKDKPDKAIFLLKPPARFGKRKSKSPRVGIEITTADPSGYLSYINERKSDKKIIHAQMDKAIESSIAPDRPLKKVGNRIHHDWIYEGIKGKAKKHDDYVSSGSFDELILLCYSNVISITDKEFYDGLNDWTDYLLSEDNYPFDKVLFLGADNNAIQVYNKVEQRKIAPIPYRYQGEVITTIQVGMIPMGVTWNYKKTVSADPIIEPQITIVDRREAP